MFMHPDVVMDLAREHRRELIADAERSHLLASAKRHRRDLRRGGPVTSTAPRGRPTIRVRAA